MAGGNFVVEDKQLQIRAGETTTVHFDGMNAQVFSLKRIDTDVAQRTAK
jgi:hypothetical protein